jgi:zinc protease
MKTFRLKNGLKILVKSDNRSAVVVSQLWYRVGGSYEPPGLTGISHALEHMMFRGTQRYPGSAFSHTVAAHGGRENAQTSRDYTFYYEEFAANELPLAFELEADRMCGLSLTGKDFAKEKQIILEERHLRVDDDPFSLTYEKFSEQAQSNAYRNPVIGWVQDIEKLNVKKLRKWYESWYLPNNAILVVVGDVDAKHVHALAKKYFGHLPPGTLPPVYSQATNIPPHEQTVTVKIPAKVPWVLLGYRAPSLVTAEPKWHAYALAVAAAVLSSGQGARLGKYLVREKQLATEAEVNYDLYDRLSGLFLLTGVPEKQVSTQQLREALLDQVHQLQTTKVSKMELARVKNQVMAREIYKKDSLFGQAKELGLLESIGLSWESANDHLANIGDVTPEQIQTVATQYLQPERLTTGILAP